MDKQRIQTLSIDDLDLPDAITPSKFAGYKTPFHVLQQVKLKYPNISLRHLGKLVGLSQEAVRQQFLRHGFDFQTGKPVAIEIFKEHRADIMASKQITVLNTLTDDKLKRASVGELNALFGTLYDKERLERGQPTSNQSVFFNIVSSSPDLPNSVNQPSIEANNLSETVDNAICDDNTDG